MQNLLQFCVVLLNDNWIVAILTYLSRHFLSLRLLLLPPRLLHRLLPSLFRFRCPRNRFPWRRRSWRFPSRRICRWSPWSEIPSQRRWPSPFLRRGWFLCKSGRKSVFSFRTDGVDITRKSVDVRKRAPASGTRRVRERRDRGGGRRQANVRERSPARAALARTWDLYHPWPLNDPRRENKMNFNRERTLTWFLLRNRP